MNEWMIKKKITTTHLRSEQKLKSKTYTNKLKWYQIKYIGVWVQTAAQCCVFFFKKKRLIRVYFMSATRAQCSPIAHLNGNWNSLTLSIELVVLNKMHLFFFANGHTHTAAQRRFGVFSYFIDMTATKTTNTYKHDKEHSRSFHTYFECMKFCIKFTFSTQFFHFSTLSNGPLHLYVCNATFFLYICVRMVSVRRRWRKKIENQIRNIV